MDDPLGSQCRASDLSPRIFLGVSPATIGVRRLIDRAARVDSTLLITGESGVGKELVAREVHARSERRHGPFVALNCAAIPDTLIESELFGSEKGAYTDAYRQKHGVFELAHKGVLLLDEVGDLSMQAQPKLLRALEEGEILRVGAESPKPVDIRIIAATNHRLWQMCQDNCFRLDLYYRLRVLEILVPPLRDRAEDIPILLEHFLSKGCKGAGRKIRVHFDDQALARLQRYHWPGNVRELKSTVERALAMDSGESLGAASVDLDPILPAEANSGLCPATGEQICAMDKDWRTAQESFEKAYLHSMLSRHSGNVQKAAQAAGLATGSVYKMMRRLGLRRDGQTMGLGAQRPERN